MYIYQCLSSSEIAGHNSVMMKNLDLYYPCYESVIAFSILIYITTFPCDFERICYIILPDPMSMRTIRVSPRHAAEKTSKNNNQLTFEFYPLGNDI